MKFELGVPRFQIQANANKIIKARRNVFTPPNLPPRVMRKPRDIPVTSLGAALASSRIVGAGMNQALQPRGNLMKSGRSPKRLIHGLDPSSLSRVLSRVAQTRAA